MLRIELFRLDEVAELGVGIDGVRLVHGEFRGRVSHLGDHRPRTERPDLAGLGVDPYLDILVTLGPAPGGLDRVLDGVDQLFTRDLLLRIELKERTHELSTHVAPPDSMPDARVHVGPPKKKRGGHPRIKAAD